MPDWDTQDGTDPVAQKEGSDAFSTSAFGKKLTLILKAMRGKSAVVLDAPWGAGKSHFIRIWRENCKLRTVYFNAFEADYYEDPLIPLCATLLEEFPERNQQARTFIKKAWNVAGTIAKVGMRAGLRAAFANLIDPRDFASEELHDVASDLKNDLEKEGVDALWNTLDSGLTEFTEGKLKFRQFREALEDLVRQPKDDKELPLVFIVDELDRCRPGFSVEVIETVKHLFDVPGVVFLLVINQEQLSSAFMSQYGCSEEAAGKYVRKFVDLRVELPRNAFKGRDTVGEFFRQELAVTWGAIPELKDRTIVHPLIDAAELMINFGDATPRDVKQIVTAFAMAHLNVAGSVTSEPISKVVASLFVLSVVSPSMMKKLQKSPVECTKEGPFHIRLLKILGLCDPLVMEKGETEKLRAAIYEDLKKFINVVAHGTAFETVGGTKFEPAKIFQMVNSMPFLDH